MKYLRIICAVICSISVMITAICACYNDGGSEEKMLLFTAFIISSALALVSGYGYVKSTETIENALESANSSGAKKIN